MMEKLSISEFKKKCESFDSPTFVFDSLNQRVWSSKCRVIARFSEASFVFNPNKICLRDGERSRFCISDVRYILHRGGDSYIGQVYDIVCKSVFENGEDIIYTIVIDKFFSKTS